MDVVRDEAIALVGERHETTGGEWGGERFGGVVLYISGGGSGRRGVQIVWRSRIECYGGEND